MFGRKQKKDALDGAKNDNLAMIALFAVFFGFLSAMIVGGAIGGAIAGAVAWVVYSRLPVDPDGRRLPLWMSLLLIVIGIVMFMLPFFLL